MTGGGLPIVVLRSRHSIQIRRVAFFSEVLFAILHRDRAVTHEIRPFHFPLHHFARQRIEPIVLPPILLYEQRWYKDNAPLLRLICYLENSSDGLSKSPSVFPDALDFSWLASCCTTARLRIFARRKFTERISRRPPDSMTLPLVSISPMRVMLEDTADALHGAGGKC